MNYNKKRNGIINNGNTCFINTAIQCLANVYDLTKYIYSNKYMKDLNRIRKESYITFEYNKVLTELIENNETEKSISLTNFLHIFCKINSNLELAKHISQNEQCDMTEFLIKLIDIIHISLQENVDIEIKGIPKNNFDRIKIESINYWIKSIQNEYSKLIDLFFGQFIYETYRDTNDSEMLYRHFDKFNNLSLEIYNNEDNYMASTLYDCFDYHCKINYLNGNNKYQIGDTNEYVDAKRMSYFWKLPKYLIISFKRFIYNGSSRKINTLIDFPIDELDLSKYVYNCDGIKSQGDVKYSLISIGNHIGDSSNSGHYYAMNRVKGTERWILYNDTQSCDIPYENYEQLKSRIISKNVYLLIYEKI